MPKRYTVVGFYVDNAQPWVDHVRAPDPHTAVRTALQHLSGSWSDMNIVEVFEGHCHGVFGNELVLNGEDLTADT